jgi:hypothetical protein
VNRRRATGRRLLRATGMTSGLVVALLFVTAAPAGAHGLGGLTPTNYETQLQRVSPRVPGLDVEIVDLGTKVQLTNHTARDVLVLGYDDEPYLRVGPHGVYENVRSPATYLNRSTTITGAPPKQADAQATPVWRKVSPGDTARWHDHRAHFMGTHDPPEVARDPGRRRVVDNFEIPMRTNGMSVTAHGQIIYVPPPSPWPWVVGALVLAGLVFVLARTRSWRTVFAVTLALLAVAEIVHVVGLWGGSTAAAGTKLAESAYSLGGIVLAVLGLVWMWRKGGEAAVPLVLVATIFLFVAGGLADVTTLGHSQVPSTFSAAFARLLVTITLGLGAGLAAAAAVRLRPPPTERSRETRRPPARTPVTS